jgi:hypothetical protein
MPLQLPYPSAWLTAHRLERRRMLAGNGSSRVTIEPGKQTAVADFVRADTAAVCDGGRPKR